VLQQASPSLHLHAECRILQGLKRDAWRSNC
jgi:hypothetical protein